MMKNFMYASIGCFFTIISIYVLFDFFATVSGNKRVVKTNVHDVMETTITVYGGFEKEAILFDEMFTFMHTGWREKAGIKND